MIILKHCVKYHDKNIFLYITINSQINQKCKFSLKPLQAKQLLLK